MFLGILSGTPEHWAQYGCAYRQAWANAGHGDEPSDIAAAVHGFVGENDREAKATYLAHERRMFEVGSAEILQMDVGGMPHESFLRSIELLGRKVLPKVHEQLERH